MRRWIATGLLAAVLGATLPNLALASSVGRRNTALGLTGGAIYTWLNGGTKHAGTRNTALLLTAGSVYAWSRYAQAHKAEVRRQRLARYNASHSYYRPVAYHPNSRVAGYRSSYSRSSSGSRRHSATYMAGYRAGYRAGIRVARA